MFVHRAFATSALLLGLAGAAHANVLYNNLGAPFLGSDMTANDSTQYNSFSTDGSGSVDTLKLLLSSSGSDGAVEVDLFADSGTNTPGAEVNNIGMVNDGDVGPSPGVVTFSGIGFTGLDPNTRYWIGLTDLSLLGGPLSTDISWAYAGDDSGIGVADEFNATTDEGSGNITTASNRDVTPYMMCVSSDSSCGVPEPASLTILGVGLAGLGLAFRRRRSA